MSPRVLVVGDVMRDIMVRPTGPLRRGTDQRAAIEIGPGGAGQNQAAWLARFGVPVRLFACVGQADLQDLQTGLRAFGVEPALIGHPVLPSGALVAMVDADGERSFLTDRGANDGFADCEPPPGLLDGIGHLHVSGYALVGKAFRTAVLSLLRSARQCGRSISFDPGSAAFMDERGGPRVLAEIGALDLCILNADEARILTGESLPDRQLRQLTGSATLAVLKRGREAALAMQPGGRLWQADPPNVAVVDTTGAGDAFLAGFLADWLEGRPVEACLARATAAGAAIVSRLGGWPEPSRALNSH